MAEGRIIRKIASINGLEVRLSNIENDIDLEEQRALQAEQDLNAAIQAEVDRAEAAELVLTNKTIDLQTELDATQVGAGLETDGSYVANGSANYISTATSLKDADTKLDAALKAEEVARLAAEEALGIRIDNILSNTDPVALDSLTEIVTEFQRVDGDLQAAITNLGQSASTGLTQEIADREAADLLLQGQIDTLTTDLETEVDRATAAEGVLRGDLAQEVQDRIDAIAQEVIDRNEAIRVGGAVDETELLTVGTGGIITLAYAPKFGRKSIMNFQCVRLVEVENGVTVYTDATVTAVSGQDKKFQVNIGNDVNAWDGKQVYVQYQYIAPSV
jgi:hypothetical protein